VIVFEKRQDRLREMMNLAPNVTALYPYEETVAREIKNADLVIGAVLIPSAKAPHVVTREMVRSMEPGLGAGGHLHRPGWLLRNVQADHLRRADLRRRRRHPFLRDQHARRPCRRTSSQAICAAILPYVNRLASDKHWKKFEPLKKGINVEGGKIVHPALKG
jgi:alanine dehydrogenase